MKRPATPNLISAGQRAGLWAVVPFQLIVMIGLGKGNFWNAQRCNALNACRGVRS